MTPVPKTIYLIVIKSITNHMLIGHGWCVGLAVKEEYSPYAGDTFTPGYYIYEDYFQAENELDLRKRCFSGVEFEVVPFRMLDQRLQNLL